jgi:uncharacterized protein (TIGR03000 family)
MSRAFYKRVLALLMVTVGLLAFDTSSADAQYSGWWQRGPVRRTVAFVVSPWVRSWRATYGSYGGYASRYAAAPSCVDWHSLCQAAAVPGAATALNQPQPDVASMVLNVPAGAEVFVNGDATTSKGATRTFFSRGLLDGEQYKYEVRIKGELDGQPLAETKTVYLTGGTRSWLEFDAAPAVESSVTAVSFTKAPTVETVLRLHLPSDATATVGGNTSEQQGSLRTFRTSKLAPGESWSDYRIVAEVERDGRRLVAEKTLTLTGGEIRDVYLDFVE